VTVPETKKPHPNDWVEIHNPALPDSPTSKVQRKSYEAVWKGKGFKLGPQPEKAKG
jgi:hypothetical protein